MRTFLFAFLCSLCLSVIVAVPAISAGQTYTVVHGDTLSSISERAHVSVTAIVRLNHLSNADYLRDGQVLRLTRAPRRPHATAKASASKKVAMVKSARRAHLASKARTSGSAQLSERQALWVAMHSGFSASDFAGSSFATAQRAIILELALTKTALGYIGVPYMWGGESLSGVDCSGFVQAVFRRNGIALPRTADAQFVVGRRIPETKLQPADLVFFQTYELGASHVGIYLGGGRFVHASSSNGVRVDSLSESYYASRYVGARRALI